MSETDRQTNETLSPNEVDRVRQVLSYLTLGAIPASYNVPVVGTAEMEEQQMRKFDEHAESTPTEIVRDGVPVLPDWVERLRTLRPAPALYESKYVLDTLFRFDTTVSSAGTTTTLLLPTIPQGKSALLDEIHVAQVSGAGSSPNGFLTDQNLSQLFAVITPDGSTFGASYKSGRNIIPGGIVPMITLQSMVAAANYLVSIQYQIRTKIDVPELDLASVFGKSPEKVKIYDDGFEGADVITDNTKAEMRYGGPYDFSGMSGDD